MSAGIWNPIIEQGITWVRVITWTDSDDIPVNITGYTVRMQIRENADDEETIVDISTTEGSIALTTPASGIFTITLSATVTATLTFNRAIYDIEMVAPAGTVTRLLQGAVRLSKEITR